MTRRLAAAVLLLLAGGCATLPPPAAEDWPHRRAALQALDAWSLDGRIAVAAGDEGFSGGFDWVQAGERADIELSGPMGGSVLRIHVEQGKAVVSRASGEGPAGDADDLLTRHLGPDRSLPVTEMRYWLVGAPAPHAPYEETLGPDRRLSGLSQSGWQVRYDRYAAVGTQSLPARVEMTAEGLRLRVVVKDWSLPP